MNSLTYRDVVDILTLLKESEHCASLDVELGDLKFSMRRQHDAAPVEPRPLGAAAATLPTAGSAVVTAPPTAPTKPSAPLAAEGTFIRAPLLGTFYRTPEPTAPPCVKVGDIVKPETTVGLIEVMKLYTTVTAGMSGRIVEILAETGELVEHNQPLFRVEPV